LLKHWRFLGPVSAGWLAQVGVNEPDELARLGVIAVYLAVKSGQPKASLNLLWGLEAEVTSDSLIGTTLRGVVDRTGKDRIKFEEAK